MTYRSGRRMRARPVGRPKLPGRLGGLVMPYQGILKAERCSEQDVTRTVARSRDGGAP